jgi:hypothetical protein
VTPKSMVTCQRFPLLRIPTPLYSSATIGRSWRLAKAEAQCGRLCAL